MAPSRTAAIRPATKRCPSTGSDVTIRARRPTNRSKSSRCRNGRSSPGDDTSRVYAWSNVTSTSRTALTSTLTASQSLTVTLSPCSAPACGGGRRSMTMRRTQPIDSRRNCRSNTTSPWLRATRSAMARISPSRSADDLEGPTTIRPGKTKSGPRTPTRSHYRERNRAIIPRTGGPARSGRRRGRGSGPKPARARYRTDAGRGNRGPAARLRPDRSSDRRQPGERRLRLRSPPNQPAGSPRRSTALTPIAPTAPRDTARCAARARWRSSPRGRRTRRGPRCRGSGA